MTNPSLSVSNEQLNLRQALLAAGWTVNDARTSSRAYVDSVGRRFGSLEKNGVRVALSISHELVDERGDVMVYESDDPCDAILRALMVDPELRRMGAARNTMAELANLCDLNSITVYLEPVPLELGQIEANHLAAFYAEFGFAFTGPWRRVMVRKPVQILV